MSMLKVGERSKVSVEVRLERRSREPAPTSRFVPLAPREVVFIEVEGERKEDRQVRLRIL